MKIILVAALDKNRVIGYRNQLPWHLPEDLKRFKQLTLGKPIIMGRKTYESIGKPLPQRRNIILSNQAKLSIPGCEVYSSLPAAINALSSEQEVMIIGGASIFQQALPLATHMYLTLINHEFVGDTYFPEWNENDWQEISKEVHDHKENSYCYEYIDLARKKEGN